MKTMNTINEFHLATRENKGSLIEKNGCHCIKCFTWATKIPRYGTTLDQWPSLIILNTAILTHMMKLTANIRKRIHFPPLVISTPRPMLSAHAAPHTCNTSTPSLRTIDCHTVTKVSKLPQSYLPCSPPKHAYTTCYIRSYTNKEFIPCTLSHWPSI